MHDTTTIQKLREVTGAGVMDCKKALEEAGGDMDRAAAIIREKGIVKMEKRSDRDASAGLIVSYVHSGRVGVIVDVRAETDFVVRSEPFQALAHDVAMHIAACAPADKDELLGQPFVKDSGKMISDVIAEVAAKVGENIQVKGFSRMEI